MSNKIFPTTDIPHEQLARMWEEEVARRAAAELEVRRLEADSKHWRAEAEKFERILNRNL